MYRSNNVNFNPLPNTDDGSCIPYIYGCTDSIATNYDSLATVDDGSCQYCDLSVSLTVMQNSSPSACDGWGFVNANSSNLPISYIWSTGSTQNNAVALCPGTYSITITDVVGCMIDTTFTIGSFPVYGCTDSLASNYDPAATASSL